MDKKTENKEYIETYSNLINRANTIIVYLNDGKAYLYDGYRQFKFHEIGSWMYCDCYKTNTEYIFKMYPIVKITKIELLFKGDSKTLYL